MTYLIQCKMCKACAWVGVIEDDPTTNSLILDDENAIWNWEDEQTAEELECKHDEYEVVDFEYNTDDDYWAW